MLLIVSASGCAFVVGRQFSGKVRSGYVTFWDVHLFRFLLAIQWLLAS